MQNRSEEYLKYKNVFIVNYWEKLCISAYLEEKEFTSAAHHTEQYCKFLIVFLFMMQKLFSSCSPRKLVITAWWATLPWEPVWKHIPFLPHTHLKFTVLSRTVGAIFILISFVYLKREETCKYQNSLQGITQQLRQTCRFPVNSGGLRLLQREDATIKLQMHSSINMYQASTMFREKNTQPLW